MNGYVGYSYVVITILEETPDVDLPMSAAREGKWSMVRMPPPKFWKHTLFEQNSFYLLISKMFVSRKIGFSVRKILYFWVT